MPYGTLVGTKGAWQEQGIIFFYGKEKENHQLEIVHRRIV